MLVGAVAVLSALLISNMAYQAAVLNMFSNQFSLYSNEQNVGAFARMMNATAPNNASNYGAWLNALYLSAKTDGIALKVENNTVAISTITLPHAYAVVRLNA